MELDVCNQQELVHHNVASFLTPDFTRESLSFPLYACFSYLVLGVRGVEEKSPQSDKDSCTGCCFECQRQTDGRSAT